MTASPTTSVVIPTYNHADYLREALQSLRSQTFEDWEAIVVNNYSEDDTASVVEAFNDPRIRLENFRNHGVIGASRNLAIELARGDFVAFLDSDDLWMPQKLERCLPLFRDGIGLVCHDLERFGRAGGIVRCGPAERATFTGLLLHGSCITPSATIIRTNVLRKVGGFSEADDVVTAEDYHLWLKLASEGVGMEFVHKVLGRYRVHSSSQSASALRHMNAVSRVVEDFSQHAASTVPLEGPAMRRRRAQISYGAGRSLQVAGNFKEARKLFGRAMREYPLYPRTYAGYALSYVDELRRHLSPARP